MTRDTSANVQNGGLGFCSILFFIFLTLKLTHYIDWSWWIIFLPLYGPLALVLGIGIIFVIGFLLYGIYEQYKIKQKVIDLIRKTKRTIKLN